MRVLFILLGGMATLIVAGIAALFLLFDPNDYRDSLTAALDGPVGR